MTTTHQLRFGVGLFTIPKLLDQDFTGTMQLLAEIGYKEVEFFGPYDFSAPAAQARWQPIANILGMKGSGYYGLTAQAVKAILARNGLTASSMHTDLLTLRERMSELAAAAHVVGARYVVLPSIPEDERATLDDYKRVADEFNQIGANAVAEGIRFAYHNHGYGLRAMDGVVPFQLVLERTDPALVDMQLDIYWNTAGGGDPIQYLQNYPGRFRLMHIKDMLQRFPVPDDMNNPQAWMALFQHISDAGSGVLDLAALVSEGSRSGVQHFLLERDLAPNSVETLRKSYENLTGLQLR
ncbi:MAG: sugar phosphate isomerase/epimerase family protein [Caldilineaceae bacterium]